MKLSGITKILNTAFNFVILTSETYKIDESHSLKHSIDVFNIANKIYNTEVNNNKFLENQKEIIQVSAILHDMCDKKYMDESKGVENINFAMKELMSKSDLDVVSSIISTMSYSKVKKYGYPDLGEYQLAYHIVREADLLSAYDVDRCLIYQMMHEKYNYCDSLNMVVDLFNNRVLKYRDDNLFKTAYSKDKSILLHDQAKKEVEYLINTNADIFL